MRTAFAVGLVWVVIFIVPIIVYGLVSAVTGLQPPGDSPARFLGGVAVAKVGTALAFVLIFFMARDALGESWPAYAALWWLMFVIAEVGQAIGPNYPWQWAVSGAVSETIYFPIAGLIAAWLLPAAASPP